MSSGFSLATPGMPAAFVVARGAWRELAAWASAHGYDAQIVCRDADDVLKLEQGAEE